MALSKFMDLDIETIGNDIVTIHVGPKRKAFSIHKKPLCSRSEDFDKAFNSGFKESDSTMNLPEDDPNAFDFLVVWIYQDRLPKFPSGKFSDDIKGCEKYTIVLEDLFFLSEKICLNELCNKIMDAKQDADNISSCIPSPMGIQYVYKNTSKGSKIRLYCAAASFYDGSLIADRKEDIQDYKEAAIAVPEYGADCLEFHLKHRLEIVAGGRWRLDFQSGTGKRGIGQCFFHIHGKGEICHLDVEAAMN
ncbi:hypothetical protein BKA65DRAFT_472291 [Rhexocercosporidium sp. MPI-PUGE-AT-0058]|nr:hypothetical protein BKA65DRAFT_472291 [Rhexocercosporidium sp. MPI-PUGE-AT-0058]